MQLIFDTIDEVRAFVKMLKTTRGGKNDADDDGTTATTGSAPAPIQPPQPGQNFQPQPGAGPATFTPPQPGPGAFPGAPQPGPTGGDPAVMALVQRIVARMDASIAAGHKAEDMRTWFCGQCATAFPEAANATLDQLKTGFLPRMPMPALENMAKLMGA